jgi:phenylpyruvate tautomerase PptA (4-oxalocrotonate tautomerase family)
MPIVTVTVTKPKTIKFKTTVLSAIHKSLVSAGVHENDRFQRVHELEPDNFIFDAHFPDVATTRNEDFVLIEILMGVGRSVKLKKSILSGIVERLTAEGLDPENVMIVFQDVPWENWSPAGGRMPHG